MNDSFLLQQIALSIIPGLGPKRTREILQLFEHPMEVFRAPLEDFQSLGFFSNQYYQAIHSRDIMQQAESILKKCLKSNIEITFFTHPNYPHRLQQCEADEIVSDFQSRSLPRRIYGGTTKYAHDAIPPPGIKNYWI